MVLTTIVGGVAAASPSPTDAQDPVRPPIVMKGGTIHAIDANGKITVRHNAPLIAEAASPQPVIGALPRSVERPNPECGVNALYIFLRLRGTDCA